MTPYGSARRGWVKFLNSRLRRQSNLRIQVVDLFSGGGGFSLGFWAAGFEVLGVDCNPDAVKTYSRNLGNASCRDLNDVMELSEADVLIAGPPCQPWSRAGKRLGAQDDRDGLGITLRLVKAAEPIALILENVPDIAREGKRQHLDDFKASLSSLGYKVSEHLLNAADYGVPQNRRRVFVMAMIGDKSVEAPEPMSLTTSVGQAIPAWCLSAGNGSQMVSDSMNAYIERYERASGCRIPRDLHLDRPARTLTVRNLCGATGDMLRLRLPSGLRRTLTIQEAARLQSFPDWYTFRGSERSRFEQIGNAVPPLLSFAVACKLKESLLQGDTEELLNGSYPEPSSHAATATMRGNRRRDTSPELRLRSALHVSGMRFRVDFPIETEMRKVRPDIVFTSKRVAVFVDGCFWHGCAEHGTLPKANASYWQQKLRKNIERDQEDSRLLTHAGWKVVRVWEHDPIPEAVANVEASLASSHY